MTRQEIYNKVRDHLLKQGRKAMIGGACVYRGADGTMCAVGCLISDAKYDPRMEGKTVCALINPVTARRVRFTPLSRPSDKTMRLLQDLQHVHDGINPREWPSELRHVAYEHGLTP